jgi:hypothetical protein
MTNVKNGPPPVPANERVGTGDIGVRLHVGVSLVVHAGFSLGERVDAERMKAVAAGLVTRLIEANGSVSPDMVDSVAILEVHDLDTEGCRLFVTV